MDLTFGPVRLRDATVSDAAQLTKWWNDGAVMAHAGFPLGLGTTEEKVARQIETDPAAHRMILLYEDLPIGEMNYRDQDGGAAEIGIKICDTRYQEKGIGKIALSLLIRALFASGHSLIRLDTNLNNTRAQHVYERLGFKKLRVNRDSWQDQLGRPQSSVDYEMTPDAFRDFAE